MLFIANKYHKWYYSIINSAKSRMLDKSVYSENHHVIPRSLGGDDSAENLVRLTAREHFICHILLTKFTEGQDRHKMISAIVGMKRCNSEQLRYMNSRLYKTVRSEWGSIASEKYLGKKNPSYGKKWWTNGEIDKKSEECPGEGWTNGRRIELSKILSEKNLDKNNPNYGKVWWNNSKIDKFARECPGEEWVKGRMNNLSTGKVWWNNGKTNTTALECPGEEWVRGQKKISRF